MNYDFPDNFWWGTATSATQSEGHNPVMVKGRISGIMPRTILISDFIMA